MGGRVALVVAFAATSSNLCHAQTPPEAAPVLQLIYSGDTDAAVEAARSMESADAKNPLGYLLEGEARWWKIYCESLEFKWNFVDAWRLGPNVDDGADLALAAKSIGLADVRLKQSETADMHLYSAMGYMLRARLLALHGDSRGTAHAGVHAREHLLRARDLDPQLADADTGLGLYNYYVDTLSSIAKFLRFFMGIPGGSKIEGMKQLQNGMEKGRLTAVEARFYFAKSLRTYDHQYERAAGLLAPLAQQFPQNPVFALMLGNMNALLDRKEEAEASYRAAAAMTLKDQACAERVAFVAREATGALGARDASDTNKSQNQR
jgi:hypothetical protein